MVFIVEKAQKKTTGFDYAGFRKRLRGIIDEGFGGRPARLAAGARKYDPGISNGTIAAYLEGRVPGIDKAAAIARAARVSLVWLIVGEPPEESKYKAKLIDYLRRRLSAAGLDDLDLTDDEILDKLVDSLIEVKPKKRRK